MGDAFRAKLDMSGIDAALAKLSVDKAESLARRMLVTGGQILRDEAKVRVAIKDGDYNYNPESSGSQQQGTLRDAIYLAFNEKQSIGTSFTYSVTWNSKKAWYGKLVEFGFFIRYQFWMDASGVFHTNSDVLLDNPIWIPAQPFLAPAYDAKISQVQSAMLERGRTELPIIIAGG